MSRLVSRLMVSICVLVCGASAAHAGQAPPQKTPTQEALAPSTQTREWPAQAPRAQAPCSVTGYISDATGLAVAGVVVTVAGPPTAGTPRTTRSDGNGVYTLKPIPAGEYRLAFEFEGFQRQERPVSIGAGATVTLDVRLELAAIPQVVKVTRDLDAEPARETPPGEMSMPGETVDQTAMGRTAEHAALMAPGVTANGPNGALTRPFGTWRGARESARPGIRRGAAAGC